MLLGQVYRAVRLSVTMKIQHAFRLGLIGTLGVGLGWLLLTMVHSLATVLTYIGVAFFIALGLDPAVRWLERKNFKKALAITTVVLAFAAFVFKVPFVGDRKSVV